MPAAAPSAICRRTRHSSAGTPGLVCRCSTEKSDPRAQYSSTIAGGDRTTPSKSTMLGWRSRAMMPTSFSSSSRTSAEAISSEASSSDSASDDSLSS